MPIAKPSAGHATSGDRISRDGARAAVDRRVTGLVLSVFPGIDLLGRAFELERWSVVRGPDLLWGGDARSFHVPAGRFEGMIAGPPCPDFSTANRGERTRYGIEMLAQFARIVFEALPDWWLLENVPSVPNVSVPGYVVQRLALNARECGSRQSRNRHFQFGSREGLALIPERGKPLGQAQPVCMATEGVRKHRRTFADFCELQGLPRDFHLPGLSREASYRAVGNGVPVEVGRTLARAITRAVTARLLLSELTLCACGCGRLIENPRAGQMAATVNCRKTLERRRKRVSPAHDFLETVTPDMASWYQK